MSPEKIPSGLEKGKALFALRKPILAHDNNNDPYINYANAAALKLWKKSWNEMIGMPSRLTAPLKEQDKRQNILNMVSKNNGIKDYQGIRVDGQGECFLIRDARIWTLCDEKDFIYGQAATIEYWSML